MRFQNQAPPFSEPSASWLPDAVGADPVSGAFLPRQRRWSWKNDAALMAQFALIREPGLPKVGEGWVCRLNMHKLLPTGNDANRLGKAPFPPAHKIFPKKLSGFPP